MFGLALLKVIALAVMLVSDICYAQEPAVRFGELEQPILGGGELADEPLVAATPIPDAPVQEEAGLAGQRFAFGNQPVVETPIGPLTIPPGGPGCLVAITFTCELVAALDALGAAIQLQQQTGGTIQGISIFSSSASAGGPAASECEDLAHLLDRHNATITAAVIRDHSSVSSSMATALGTPKTVFAPTDDAWAAFFASDEGVMRAHTAGADSRLLDALAAYSVAYPTRAGSLEPALTRLTAGLSPQFPPPPHIRRFSNATVAAALGSTAHELATLPACGLTEVVLVDSVLLPVARA